MCGAVHGGRSPGTIRPGHRAGLDADKGHIAGGIGAEAVLQPGNDGLHQIGEAPVEVLPLLKRASSEQAAGEVLVEPDRIGNRDDDDFTADGALPVGLVQIGRSGGAR